MKYVTINIFATVFSINGFSQSGIYLHKPKANTLNRSLRHKKNAGTMIILSDSTKNRWCCWIDGQVLWDMTVTCKINMDTLFLTDKSNESIPVNTFEDKLIIQDKSLISLTMKGLVYHKKKRVPKRARELFAIKRKDFNRFVLSESLRRISLV